MAVKRTGARIYHELLKAAEIFIIVKPKESLLMIMRLPGLDIGQWSTHASLRSLESISQRHQQVVYKRLPGFYSSPAARLIVFRNTTNQISIAS